jgi:hypothetical protein
VCVPGSVWSPTTGGGPIGYQVKHVNAKGQQVVRGEISGKDAAVHTVDGSLHLHSVEIGGCGTWMRHGGRGEPCIIEACDGDSGRTFLELVTNQTAPVLATSNRFYQLYDGPLFVLGDNIGPVTLMGNEFANGGHKTPAQCYSTVPANGPVLTAIGNTFPNDQVLPVPNTAVAGRLRSLYALGNMYYGPGNTRNLLNDYLAPNRNTGDSLASLQIHGSSGFKSDVQTLNNAGVTIQSNQGHAHFTSAAFYTLTSKPTIRPGLFEGQELELMNVGGNDLGLLDEKSLPGSQLCLLERSPVFKPKSSARFKWTASYGGRWIQVSPVVSPL